MLDYIKNNIKDIGTKVREPDKILKKAKKEFENKSYLKAEQLASKAQKTIEGLQHSKLDQFLFVFRQLRAEEMITETKKLIVSIKEIYNSGQGNEKVF